MTDFGEEGVVCSDRFDAVIVRKVVYYTVVGLINAHDVVMA